MQWGAHTFGFVWHSDAEAAFDAIANAGFRNVQLMATPPHFDPWNDNPSTVAKFAAQLARRNLTLLAADLASSDVNLASSSRDVVAFSIDAYRRLIARCADLGARWVCVGSGRRHALLPRANLRLMESFRAAFATIVAEAERRDIGVILENHPQGLLADAKSIEHFLSQEGYAALPVIYDVANAVAIGEDPAHGLIALRHRLGIVHLSDSPAGQWRHDPIGSGDIDFAAVAHALQVCRFEGPAVLEILADDPAEALIEGRNRLGVAGFAAASED